MTLHPNLLAQTRPIVLASATGLALCSLNALAFAQVPTNPSAPGQLQPVGAQQPRLLPIQNPQMHSISEAPQQVQLAAGQETQMSNYDSSRPSANHPVNNNQTSRGPGFTERIGRIFKGAPTTAPVDPGMVYPKASDHPQANTRSIPSLPPASIPNSPPPAPAASGMEIPSIPPRIPGIEPQLINVQNAPISENSIPPIPPLTTGSRDLQTASTETGSFESPTTTIPPLNELPQSTLTEVASQDEPAGVVRLPKLESQQSIPSIPPAVAPGEPSAAMSLVVPPPSDASTPKPNADPFLELFPADKKSEQVATSPEIATPSPAPAVAKPAEPVNQPYTGLSLEMDSVPSMPNENAASLTALDTSLPKIESPASSDSKLVVHPMDLPALPAKQMEPAPLQLPAESELPIVQPSAKPTQVASSAPDLNLGVTSTPKAESPASKLEKIASRKDLKGLKGFCPVALRDERNLIEASAEFVVTHNGTSYEVSSPEAMKKFQAEPSKYAPASNGCDPIHAALTGEQLPGSLEHAVWYKGRLYLFSSVETMETFTAAPSSHIDLD
ncbi:hypothetical protein SH668x_003044 [Planctomicrobium sp. SH668]|uniref:hypothetical protein n=1 Tax=Planctomicrobium sp. SH668 TaxID=3448126 RepID=UPI003F5B3D79